MEKILNLNKSTPSTSFCVIFALLACLLCSKHAIAQLTTSQQTLLVNLHNIYRGEAKPAPCPALPSVTFSLTLASVAQSYANECNYNHNGQRTTDANGAFSYVGENLALTTQTLNNVSELAKAWNDEHLDYTFATRACATGKACGHYTQIVWKTSTSLGCGAKVCQTASTTGLPASWQSQSFTDSYPQVLLLVCNYGPGGNYQNQSPYTACPMTSSTADVSTTATVASVTSSVPTTNSVTGGGDVTTDSQIATTADGVSMTTTATTAAVTNSATGGEDVTTDSQMTASAAGVSMTTTATTAPVTSSAPTSNSATGGGYVTTDNQMTASAAGVSMTTSATTASVASSATTSNSATAWVNDTAGNEMAISAAVPLAPLTTIVVVSASAALTALFV